MGTSTPATSRGRQRVDPTPGHRAAVSARAILIAIFVALAGCHDRQPAPGEDVHLAGGSGTSTDILFSTAWSETAVPGPRDVGASGPPIIVDSVPRGAEVYLVPEQDDGRPKKWLGRTPLMLDPADCPGRSFWIRFELEPYLDLVDAQVPQLRAWVAMVRSDAARGYLEHPFDFDVTTSTEERSLDSRVLAIGPVYKLNDPTHNRVCALFTPNLGMLSALRPLMPARGSFEVPESDQMSLLSSRLGIDAQQAESATEILSRCGKTVVLARDPSDQKKHHIYILDVQGHDNSRLVVSSFTRDAGKSGYWYAPFLIEALNEIGLIAWRDRANRYQTARPAGSSSITIESVPPGADVYALPDNGDLSGRRPLGRTPLRLDPDDFPTRLWVTMNLAGYIEQLQSTVPELARWARQLRTMIALGADLAENFDFEAPTTHILRDASGTPVALGPELGLPDGKANRLCVVFLPRGADSTAFFRFLGPVGSYRIRPDTWLRHLQDNYHVRATEAVAAVEWISRGGTAQVSVPDPTRPSRWLYTIIVQGPGNDSVLVRIREVSGYRYQRSRNVR